MYRRYRPGLLLKTIVVVACFGWGLYQGLFAGNCPTCHQKDMVKPEVNGVVSADYVQKHPDVHYGGRDGGDGHWYCARCKRSF